MRGAATLGDRILIVLAPLVGGGGLVLLVAWPRGLLDLHLGDGAALAWDALLSLAFFLQHSLMVRRPIKARLARHVPARQLAAIYSVASGLALGLAVVLWQPTEARLATVEGPARWIGLALALLALAGFAWGVASLGGFDAFGDRALRRHARGEAERPPALTIRGPYRWVRHPLYLFALILIWSNLDLTADQLLFDVLWTAWIVVGTILEERDLVAELGDPYREYQRRVPMLVPWRRPAEATPPPARHGA
jgi:protein-S-isoprenylcysteine O-methyltransferase Ste14